MKTISFCVSIKNRLWQLRETLSYNLSNLGADEEIVIADCNSKDGLSAWLWENFSSYIENQQLIYAEISNMDYWHSPIAKNIAHRLARGNYVFSLDADNYIAPADLEHIRQAASAAMSVHQFSGDWHDGSCGRIGLTKALFLRLGGYDEGLLPVGMQDIDLINRIKSSGGQVKLIPPPLRLAVQNNYDQKVQELPNKTNDGLGDFRAMVKFNYNLSEQKIKMLGPRRLSGYATVQGRINNRPFRLDGLNNIYFPNN